MAEGKKEGNYEYQITLGQDCSTLRLMGYTGLKRLPFIFDGIACYSDDYLNLFGKDNKVDLSSIKVFIKDDISKLMTLYNNLKAGVEMEWKRVNYHAIIGKKYDTVYIDSVHFSNDSLVPHLKLDSFEEFLKSVDEDVKRLAVAKLKDNIRDFNEVMANHKKDKIVFFRTIKHVLSKIERVHLVELKRRLKDIFPNSRLVVISDMEENKTKDGLVTFFRFDHWKINDIDKANFRNLLKKMKIL